MSRRVGVGLGLTSSGFNGGLEVTDIVKNGPVARNGRWGKTMFRWIWFLTSRSSVHPGRPGRRAGLAAGEREALNHTFACSLRKSPRQFQNRLSASGSSRGAVVCSDSLNADFELCRVKRGDVLKKVNGVAVASSVMAREHLLGEAGSTCSLTFLRLGAFGACLFHLMSTAPVSPVAPYPQLAESPELHVSRRITRLHNDARAK